MSTFNPDKPCRVHDALNDRTFDWKTGLADHYRRKAIPSKADGRVSYDGLVLDGWRD